METTLPIMHIIENEEGKYGFKFESPTEEIAGLQPVDTLEEAKEFTRNLFATRNIDKGQIKVTNVDGTIGETETYEAVAEPVEPADEEGSENEELPVE